MNWQCMTGDFLVMPLGDELWLVCGICDLTVSYYHTCE